MLFCFVFVVVSVSFIIIIIQLFIAYFYILLMFCCVCFIVVVFLSVSDAFSTNYKYMKYNRHLIKKGENRVFLCRFSASGLFHPLSHMHPSGDGVNGYSRMYLKDKNLLYIRTRK